MKLNHLLTPHTRINSKWIKDLNIRLEAVKILDENLGSKIWDTACSNILSEVSPSGMRDKRENKHVGLHQTRRFLHSKGQQQSTKTTLRVGEHIRQYTDKGLISNIYKELIKLHTKTNNRIRKWAKT